MKTAVKNILVNHPDFGRLEVSVQTNTGLLMLDRVIHLADQYGNNAKFPTKLVRELATAYKQKSQTVRNLQRKIADQKEEDAAIIQCLESGYMQAKSDEVTANNLLSKFYEDVSLLVVRLESAGLDRDTKEALSEFETKLLEYEKAMGITRNE